MNKIIKTEFGNITMSIAGRNTLYFFCEENTFLMINGKKYDISVPAIKTEEGWKYREEYIRVEEYKEDNSYSPELDVYTKEGKDILDLVDKELIKACLSITEADYIEAEIFKIKHNMETINSSISAYQKAITKLNFEKNILEDKLDKLYPH